MGKFSHAYFLHESKKEGHQLTLGRILDIWRKKIRNDCLGDEKGEWIKKIKTCWAVSRDSLRLVIIIWKWNQANMVIRLLQPCAATLGQMKGKWTVGSNQGLGSNSTEGKRIEGAGSVLSRTMRYKLSRKGSEGVRRAGVERPILLPQF